MNTVSINIKKYLSIDGFVVLYFFLLLLLGKSFTKVSIGGPLYLHDLFLFALTLFALSSTQGKIKLRFPALVLIMLLAFIYFLVSFFSAILQDGHLLMVFRQYYLFVYLTCAYVLFNTLVTTDQDLYKPVNLMILIARASVPLQIIFLIGSYIFVPGFSVFKPLDYSYFSALTIFGIIVYGAYLLAFVKNPLLKSVYFILNLLLATTLGHSSAFLALLVILLVYFFVHIIPLQRFIAVVLITGAVLLLLFLPQFHDHNASWRLLYWQHVLKNAVYDKYFFFGSGFGQPYMKAEYAAYLKKVLGTAGMMDNRFPMARYLSPPHNSILTIIFHIGLLPGLLILWPMKKYFSHLFLERKPADPVSLFLIMSLTGCLIWICFNVILELPHSATFFWLVYLTTAYYLNQASKTERSSK